jgi:glycosyltransferase involved in cell wall biosynthesis
MIDFKVSVIIPVYNVAEYINQAVLSAVNLPEVAEIILVDDGSPDDSLFVCQKLEKEFEKIRCFQHPNGINKGISASRNLGIGKAVFPYIAFLDADDWYLPHRFKKDKIIFEKRSFADAAYSCAILEEHLGNNDRRYGIRNEPKFPLKEGDTPYDFYKNKITLNRVLFHTNSVTLKREFLIKEKIFDERLRLHEDTELWNRLIRRGLFIASEWKDPVAVIRRHGKNNITSRNINTHLKMLAIQIDNIGLDNLYEFEIKTFYMRGLREKSTIFKNHWIRRITYFSSYALNMFQKRKFLKKLRDSYALN